MIGFFHQTNQWRRALQIYNTLAFTIAAYELVNNPAASIYEVGADMLIHLATCYSLGKDASAPSELGWGAVNLMRIGAIYAGVTSGISAFSSPLNALDAVGHLLNAGTLIFDDEGVRPESTQGHALPGKF